MYLQRGSPADSQTQFPQQLPRSRAVDVVTPDLDVEMLEQETLDMLDAAIRSLPLKYQELLRMSYHDGLKNAEIAERLGVAEITVKKQKARLLAMLRERMDNCPPYIIAMLMESYVFTA